jgi:hypothetical protein
MKTLASIIYLFGLTMSRLAQGPTHPLTERALEIPFPRVKWLELTVHLCLVPSLRMCAVLPARTPSWHDA